jgi:hypothetical protein
MSALNTIVEASRAHEASLAKEVTVVKADLNAKHAAMVADAFSFFRATYYRWAQLWMSLGREWAFGPRLLCVGDLHLENFGTWRDAEGRLVWGVNDFDECGVLSFSHDLVRLATSALLAIGEDRLAVTAREACEALLQGYVTSVKAGGKPFILEEQHPWLRKLAVGKLRDPAEFWAKIEAATLVTAKTPAEVMNILRKAMPSEKMNLRVVHRQSGLGSLGRPRFAAVGVWNGGLVAREAKAILTNGADWARGEKGSQAENMKRMIAHPLRSTDPMNEIHGGWVLRRLSPHCSRIELGELPAERDEEQLLFSMGWELANLHLDGSSRRQKTLRQEVTKRPSKWLLKGARTLADATLADWKKWRKAMK